MKKLFIFGVCAFCAFGELAAAESSAIKLDAPDKSRGSCVMEAFSNRKSTKSFSARPLSMRDLSDLLWAANGVNRDDGRRTAPSAMNRKDIKIYVCMKDGAYLYDADAHSLVPVCGQDLRQSKAPVTLVLVSDFNDRWSGLDAGIVSQNISIFCAGVGLGTYPHTTMDSKLLRTALKLSESQTPMICNSVGFAK